MSTDWFQSRLDCAEIGADDREKTEPHSSKFVPEYPFQGVGLDLSCHEREICLNVSVCKDTR